MIEPTRRQPSQARSRQTERALVEALNKLLRHRPFDVLTVAEIASEAGVTTGAIYRRFRDKQDLLNRCFEDFLEKTQEDVANAAWHDPSLTDSAVVAQVLHATMRETVSNIHLMKAASSVQALTSFERMLEARTLVADRMAARLRTSQLSNEDLNRRSRFLLRVATATFRDTFLAGHGAITEANSWEAYLESNRQSLQDMLNEIEAMALLYLAILPSADS